VKVNAKADTPIVTLELTTHHCTKRIGPVGREIIGKTFANAVCHTMGLNIVYNSQFVAPENAPSICFYFREITGKSMEGSIDRLPGRDLQSNEYKE